MSLKIDPLKYLGIKQPEIIFKLTKEMGYSDLKADRIYLSLAEIVNQLRPLRAYKSLTYNCLEEKLHPLSFKARSITVNFLLKALNPDDTYCHAFNFLAVLFNRDQVTEIKLKKLAECVHLQMLEQEKEQTDGAKASAPLQPETAEQPSEKKYQPSDPGVKTRNVFCDNMPLHIPVDHFKVFIEKKSKNGRPFLLLEQYDAFIERAFSGNAAVPKQKFNHVNGEKLLIQAEFYHFYYDYCFEYFNTMKCRDNFVRLLTDNFEGWAFKNVKENFKPKKDARL